MILALDMGNTNIVIGCIDSQKTYFVERVTTDHAKTGTEYAINNKNILEIHQINPSDIEGAIMSSVVPPLNAPISSAVKKILGFHPMLVGAGIKTGMNIIMDNPKTVGSDMIVDAVAAIREYPGPIIIIDMGTATTISAMDRHGKMLEQSVTGCFRRFQFQIDKGIFLRMLILKAQVFQLCLDGEKPQTVC